MAKTIFQVTVKVGRRQGRQRKRWEENIREWTGLEFLKSQRVVENREKWEKKTGCKIICGAPTTLAVKGWMMMMMIVSSLVSWCFEPSQPQRITSGLKTTSIYLHVIHFTSHYTKSLFFSNHNSNSIHNSERNPRKTTTHELEPIYISRALNTGTCIQQGDLFYFAGLHRNRC